MLLVGTVRCDKNGHLRRSHSHFDNAHTSRERAMCKVSPVEAEIHKNSTSGYRALLEHRFLAPSNWFWPGFIARPAKLNAAPSFGLGYTNVLQGTSISVHVDKYDGATYKVKFSRIQLKKQSNFMTLLTGHDRQQLARTGVTVRRS